MIAIVSQLRRELAESQQNYTVLLNHAQTRMNEANEELHRLKTTLEVELSATKAKLLKAELKASSLEGILGSKSKENAELTTICDELIMKIDAQSAVATGSTSKSADILTSLNLKRPM